MAMEQVVPKLKESFGTMRLLKRAAKEDVTEWQGRAPQVIARAYEVESSTQEGSIIVHIPVQEAEIDCDKHYDEVITLINPTAKISIAVKNRNVEGKRMTADANYEIFAQKIQLGGNK